MRALMLASLLIFLSGCTVTSTMKVSAKQYPNRRLDDVNEGYAEIVVVKNY